MKRQISFSDEIIKPDARMNCIPVSVNGNKLPLNIGSKLDIGDGLIRTVMKMQINEDCNVLYGIQWIDGIEFKLEWMTFSEICFMSNSLKNRPKISL